MVFTAFDVTVLTVFKGDSTVTVPQGNIFVRRGGGVRDRGDHIDEYLSTEFPLFQQREQFIMFLRFLPAAAAYVGTTGGADSFFEVRTPNLNPRGKTTLSVSLGRLSDDELRARLQVLRRAR
jgi:hypothetical protein